MARLVGAGYARPGQTGRALFASFTLDVICSLAYAMVIEGRDADGRREVDRALGLVDEGEVVEKELSDGRVVQISEARLARIRANQAAMSSAPRRGDER